MPYMVTFTINIPQMLASIYHTWILWVCWRMLKVSSSPRCKGRRRRTLPQRLSSLHRLCIPRLGRRSRGRRWAARRHSWCVGDVGYLPFPSPILSTYEWPLITRIILDPFSRKPASEIRDHEADISGIVSLGRTQRKKPMPSRSLSAQISQLHRLALGWSGGIT